MVFFLRLPFVLIELLLRRLFGREEQQRFAPTPASGRSTTPAFTATPPRGPDGPPPPTAEEAIARRFDREAAEGEIAPDLTPPTSLRPIADDGHVDEEAELVESFGPAADVGATLTVDEPWDGYAQQPAAAIVARLRGADPATKAVAALYERGHKNRATVLRATG
jgi:hypothetical protein